MANLMKQSLKLTVMALVMTLAVGEAQAMALNRCVKIVRDPQVNRETLVNTCNQCLTAKVERRRPGNDSGTPNMRDFTLLPGAAQPLPFLGPGSSRILNEAPCPQVQR